MKRSLVKSRISSFVIALAILVMSLIVSFHSHAQTEGSVVHHACQVCVLGHQFNLGLSSTSSVFILTLNYEFYFQKASELPYVFEVPLSYHSQAPPRA